MKRLFLLLSLVVSCATLHASVTIDLFAGQLLTAGGSPLPDGALVQLVASTTDNTFTAPTATSFTGGSSDDVVLASFTLNSATTGSAGSFDKLLQFNLSGGLSSGDELLLRWYPALTAASTAPGTGASYGQFRTDAVVDKSDIAWVIPSDGSTDSLNFATSTEGGSQPNSAGEATQTVSQNTPTPSPEITSATTASAIAGQPFSYAIEATNSPASYGATGLPPGVTVNASSGVLAGTPTQPGVFSVKVVASNAGGSGSATLTVTVAAEPVAFPTISSAGTAAVAAGQAFAYQITATHNPASFGATGLPAGLAVDAATGLISGIPTDGGVFNVGLSATNAGGTGTAVLTLTVSGAVVTPPLVAAPVITSVLSVDAQTGASFEYAITGSNQPTSFGAAGLPGALHLDAASGLISGQPTVAGAHTIVVSAANAAGTGTATLQLIIRAAPLPVVKVTATIPSVTAGTGAFGQFTLTLSKVMTSPVLVSYALKGTAENGTNYQLLPGTKKIKAGQKTVNIKVVPKGDLDGAAGKVVSFILESGKTYTIGTTKPVKVKILAGK